GAQQLALELLPLGDVGVDDQDRMRRPRRIAHERPVALHLHEAAAAAALVDETRPLPGRQHAFARIDELGLGAAAEEPARVLAYRLALFDPVESHRPLVPEPHAVIEAG